MPARNEPEVYRVRLLGRLECVSMPGMTEDPTLTLLRLHRAIRRVLAERMEHGTTDELDRVLLALRVELERVERSPVFS